MAKVLNLPKDFDDVIGIGDIIDDGCESIPTMLFFEVSGSALQHHFTLSTIPFTYQWGDRTAIETALDTLLLRIVTDAANGGSDVPSNIVINSFTAHLIAINIPSFPCPGCDESFTTTLALSNHILTCCADRYCNRCDMCVDDLSSHLPRCSVHRGTEHVISAIGGAFKQIRIKPTSIFGGDVEALFIHMRQRIIDIINDSHDERTSIKFYLGADIKLYKLVDDDEGTIWSFNDAAVPLLPLGDPTDQVIDQLQNILNRLDELVRKGSGWVVEGVEYITINMSRYNPVGGSSWFPTPPSLHRRGIVNVHNSDNDCFVWSFLAARHRVEGKNHHNADRTQHYEADKASVNMQGIATPVVPKACVIERFERQNNCGINVLGYSSGSEDQGDKKCFPLHVSKVVDKPVYTLLLITNPKNNEKHYTAVVDISALLNANTKNTHKKFYCMNCLQGYVKKSRKKKTFFYIYYIK